ncbi:MAG: hypothetical protein C4318_00535 [Acidimicrobiia bacterium]
MSEEISIRKAEHGDVRFLYEIRNDPAVVEASATGRGVEWKSHLLWIDQKLRQGALLFIAVAKGRPVGYIRFDPLLESSDSYEVAVGLVEAFRQRGIGTSLILKGSLLAESLGASKLLARIKPDNTASVRAFQAAGYTRDPDTPTVTSEAGIRLDRYIRVVSIEKPAETKAFFRPIGSCEPLEEEHAATGNLAPGNTLRVVLVADFGQSAGLGHLRRMSALGTAIAAYGSAYAIAIAGPRDDTTFRRAISICGRAVLHVDDLKWGRQVFDAAVIDSYRLSEEEMAGLSPSAIVADGVPPSIAAPMLVDPAPGADKSLYVGRAEEILTGAKFALLGPELWDLTAALPTHPPRRILVTLGSGAEEGLTTQVVEALRTRLGYLEVVTTEHCTPPYEYISRLVEADMVVTAGGVSSLETARAGRPAVGVVLSPNHIPNIKGLAEAGALRMSEAKPNDIASAVAEIARERELFYRLAAAGPRLIDGKGACRVAKTLLARVRAEIGASKEEFR